VCPRLGGLGEAAGPLEHEVDAELLPGQLGRVGDRGDLHLLAVDDEAVGFRRHGGVEATVHGVVLEQVRQRRRIGDVVDRHELEIRIGESLPVRSVSRSVRNR